MNLFWISLCTVIDVIKLRNQNILQKFPQMFKPAQSCEKHCYFEAKLYSETVYCF